MIIRIALPLLLAVCNPSLAFAFPSPTISCPLAGTGNKPILSIDGLPLQIFHELQRRFGNTSQYGIDMAPRDADWQVTDVIISTDPPLSFRRFIQADHKGPRWYVWYESGGMGHAYHIGIFDLPVDALRPRLVIHTFALQPEQLCAETKKHLDDASDTPEQGYMW